MWLFNSASGILTLELSSLVILILVLAKRLTSKKADQDLTAMGEFFDNIDKQTLIKISDIDQRADYRQKTIHKDIEEIDYNSRLIKTALENEAIQQQVNVIGLADICLTNVSKAYLRILAAVNAIKDRENARLQKENDELAAKLKEASKLIDEVTQDYTRVIPISKKPLNTEQKRLIKAIKDVESDLITKDKR